MNIHPTAIIDPKAELGTGVEIGPHVIIEAGVTVGPRCRVEASAFLKGPMEIGEDTIVGFGAALGHEPQLKRHPDDMVGFGRTRIGKRNIFREHSSVHRSMDADGVTIIGDDCLVMGGGHIAHDCVLRNEVIMANHVLLAGHVVVGNKVRMSGGTCVHQFCRIGELAMLGGGSTIAQDVAPYCMLSGERPAHLKGLNVIGMRRAGFTAETRDKIKKAYRTLFRSNLLIPDRIRAVKVDCPEVERLIEFVQTTERGVVGFFRSGERHHR